MGSGGSRPQPTPQPTPYPTHPGNTQPPTTKPTPSPTCQTFESDTPQLKVTVANMKDAGTGDDVYARVLYGSRNKRKTGAVWTDWRKLDHSGCDNLEKAQTDYFNQFEDITDAWEAVAVYNCGDDSVIIDSVGVWNGDGTTEINYFCPLIAGPSKNCGETMPENIGECYKGSGQYPFDYFRLDQINCDSMAFLTTSTTSLKKVSIPVAAPEYLQDPGIPNCAALGRAETAELSVAHSGTFQVQTGAVSVEYGLIALLVAIIVAVVLVFTYLKKKYVGSVYKQIPDQSTAEERVDSYA